MKLTDIVPQKLSEVSDQELFRIWETFSYLIKNPKANREEIINRGTFIFNELISRDLEIEKNDLKSDIEERKKQKESDDKNLSEAVRPPFGSPGGKRYMADRLVRMFPEHKVYVEPFVGAGGVFYKKKKVEGVQEIINDKDKDIIFCFKTIQNLTDVQWAELKKMDWTASKSGFAKAKKSLESVSLDFEEQIANFDIEITKAKMTYPINFNTILDLQDEKSLIERRLEQAQELLKELF